MEVRWRTFPAVRWELGWLRLSQAGFKAVGELTQEEEKPHQFDVAMRNKESGIGYTYTRPSAKARFRQNEDLLKEVFEEAKKFADGAFLIKQLGEKVTALDMKATSAAMLPQVSGTEISTSSVTP